MPSKGWTTISVKEELRKKLEDLASELGFSSLNDLLVYLLESYNVVVAMGTLDDKLSKILSILIEMKKAGKTGSES